MISTGSISVGFALPVLNPIVSKRQGWDSLSQNNRILKHRISAKYFYRLTDIQG